ncbi:MAG TPA: hypothetical protein VK348_10720, partial [Planctomycetota bacterium]|nr:hypothetical protein [Planctomycetota bacterium]
QLKQGTRPKVFVIGVGGGPDLWAAKQYDASLIRGIELNQAVLDVHRTVAKDFSKPLLDDPRVQMICDEGRTSLMRTDESFDVVQLTGIDTWTALNSGAYVLAENYLYTVEACRTMYGRLNDGGILQITRMAAGMETIRLMNNMYHALPLPARERFRESVAALGTDDGLIAVLLKKGVFTPAEVDQLTSFAEQNQIDKVVLPGKQLGTAAEEFVVSPDRDAFVAHYKFDISPTTDDRPYFFSFLRWDNPLSFLFASKSTVAREYLHKPTSMVQGNPMFLWLQLLCSAIAAALFIVVPLLFRRGAANRSRQGALPLFCYFAGLGIGFIGIEVALIQKFTLLLGQPIYSIVVTLFSILVATGIGSWLSSKVLRQGPRVARFVPLGICALLGLIAFGSQHLVDACIGLPLPARAAVTALVIAPLALLLGMPFAYGITLVQKVNPSFVPWAWAVNGSTTVIGSIATVILSMNFGFAAVLLLCGVVYLLAFAAVDRLAIRVLAE